MADKTELKLAKLSVGLMDLMLAGRLETLLVVVKEFQ